MNQTLEVEILKTELSTTPVWEGRISHKSAGMADRAGIHKTIWRPHEIGADYTDDIVELLEDGIRKLEDDPYKFVLDEDVWQSYEDKEEYWQSYEELLHFSREYLNGCKVHPGHRIKTYLR